MVLLRPPSARRGCIIVAYHATILKPWKSHSIILRPWKSLYINTPQTVCYMGTSPKGLEGKLCLCLGVVYRLPGSSGGFRK